MIKALSAVGLPLQFVNWIRELITSPCYTVRINGSQQGYFKGARGLRQGDPLSPYLFVIVMEVISGIMRNMAANKQFNWHPRCRKMKLDHLIFADDLLIFTTADRKSIGCVKEVLDQFYVITGMQANSVKSAMFFGGCSPHQKSDLLSIVGFSEGFFPFRYLGLPLSSKKIDKQACQLLFEKVNGKINHWHKQVDCNS